MLDRVILAALLRRYVNELDAIAKELDELWPGERPTHTEHRRKPEFSAPFEFMFATPEVNPEIFDVVQVLDPHPELDRLRELMMEISTVAEQLGAADASGKS